MNQTPSTHSIVETMQEEMAKTVDAKETSADISKMLSSAEQNNHIVVDTHEQAHAEFVRRTNLDKSVILKTLFGMDKFGGFDIKQKVTLPALFRQYFKGLINDVYAYSDLQKLAELLAKEKDDAPYLGNLSRIKPVVKKGNYSNKQAFIFHQLDHQCMIGASRPDCAVYFVFTNDKSDVNNGVIYVRNGSAGVLRRVNTFEVNPFVSGKGIVTDPETGASEVKDQLTFNPGWLGYTVSNMERYVFAPLVWMPPKPVKAPKHARPAPVSEVDMGKMIEKALGGENSEQVQVEAEKMAEEVRSGIDAYAANAMAEIAKRDGKIENANVSGAVIREGETLQSDSLSLTAQMLDAAQQAGLNPSDVVVFDEPDYGAYESKDIKEAINSSEVSEMIREATRTPEKVEGATVTGSVELDVGEDGIQVDKEALSGLAFKPFNHDLDVTRSYPCTLPDEPNETTKAAFEESRQIIENGTARFKTAAEMFAHLDGKLEHKAGDDGQTDCQRAGCGLH